MAWSITETLYFVSDFDGAVRHYTEQLGFTLASREDWGFAVLTLAGHQRIAIVKVDAWDTKWKQGDPLPKPRLACRTDDIEAEVARLRETGVDVDEIVGDPDTIRSTTFRDPEGNAFFLWDDGSGSD